jgi:DNA-binding NarL/FixJ family response regulator
LKHILLVDDHAMFRDGVSLLLAELDPAPTVLQAGDCAQARIQLEQHPDIDLILLDLELPGESGASGLKAMRSDYPDIPVVVLSAHESTVNVQLALDHGAMGFIPKSSSSGVMLAALNLVKAGGIYLPPLMLATAPADAEDEPVRNTTEIRPADIGLSERQARVLLLLLRGLSNKHISRELDLAPSTVKSHVSAVFRALRVSTRTQAVIAASRLNLVLDPE